MALAALLRWQIGNFWPFPGFSQDLSSMAALFDAHRCLLTMTGSDACVINTAESTCSSPAKTKQSPHAMQCIDVSVCMHATLGHGQYACKVSIVISVYVLQCMSGEILTGAISHSRRVLHGTPVGLGCPTGTILHGVNAVFQSNRNDFPRLPLHLMEYVGIWGRYLQLEVNKLV
jgi:hypothetical protein